MDFRQWRQVIQSPVHDSLSCFQKLRSLGTKRLQQSMESKAIAMATRSFQRRISWDTSINSLASQQVIQGRDQDWIQALAFVMSAG
jgi:hypothetical protein